MLQFFITATELYGLDYYEPTSQEKFRVVFHEEVDRSFSPETIKSEFILPNEVEAYELPMTAEYALDVKQVVSYMFEYDYRFDGVLASVARTIGFKNRPEYKDLSDNDFEGVLWNSLEPLFEEDKKDNNFITTGSRVLGYPYFTQSDIREKNSPYSGYDVLLFQLDSECYKPDKDNTKWMVIWGDCGIGNFFIRKQDLLNRDFSNVLYNWDCF